VEDTLGKPETAEEYWNKLKTLYNKTTVQEWVKELTTLLTLTRNPGEDSEIFDAAILACGSRIHDNLEKPTLNKLLAYRLIMSISEDLQPAVSQFLQEEKWSESRDILKGLSGHCYSNKTAVPLMSSKSTTGSRIKLN